MKPTMKHEAKSRVTKGQAAYSVYTGLTNEVLSTMNCIIVSSTNVGNTPFSELTLLYSKYVYK